MAHDYEDINDLDSLDDDELAELVRNHLREHAGIDAGDISVKARDGAVTLSGRVGNEGEQRVAEHIVTDVIGITEVRNNLVVSTMRRAESPMAADEHVADEEEHSGLLLGDAPSSHTDESAHLVEDLDARLYGTTDRQDAIESGTPYVPPTSPTPEGFGDTESGTGAYGEDR